MTWRSLLLLAWAACCGCDEEAVDWVVVDDQRPAALTSVWGTSARDVWAVGADLGEGPAVLHWDGARWQRLASGARGDLWWVFGFADGPVYLGGADGLLLRYADGAFVTQPTPGQGTVFGIWGATPDDVWAVGGAANGSSGAFAWRLDGGAWVQAADFPTAALADKAVWKVVGGAVDDVWLVGTGGLAVHYDGAAFSVDNLGSGESLFTVAYDAGRFVAVGGFATGLVWEHEDGAWHRAATGELGGLLGVTLRGERGYAVGAFGAVAERRRGEWRAATSVETSASLHAVWGDPDGGLWAVGGQLQTRPLIEGILAYRGEEPPRSPP